MGLKMISTKKNYDEENVYSIRNHYDVVDLSSNSIAVQINLDRNRYTLRKTRLGKLILTQFSNKTSEY
jgi:hypothetical protein